MPQKFPYTTMSMFSSKYWHPLYREATNSSDLDKMNALRLIDKFLTAFTIRLEYTDDYKMYVSSMELEKQRIYGLEVYDTYYKLLVKGCFEAIIPFERNAEIEFTDLLLGKTTMGNVHSKELSNAIKNCKMEYIRRYGKVVESRRSHESYEISKEDIDDAVDMILDYMDDQIIDVATNVASKLGIGPEPDTPYDDIYEEVYERIASALAKKLAY